MRGTKNHSFTLRRDDLIRRYKSIEKSDMGYRYFYLLSPILLILIPSFGYTLEGYWAVLILIYPFLFHSFILSIITQKKLDILFEMILCEPGGETVYEVEK